MARTRVRCPNAPCRKLNPRQEMMDPETLERAGLSDNWIWRAHRCTYCHVVYTMERHRGKVQRGWYDQDGWRFVWRSGPAANSTITTADPSGAEPAEG